jgi:hypothetical protein
MTMASFGSLGPAGRSLGMKALDSSRIASVPGRKSSMGSGGGGIVGLLGGAERGDVDVLTHWVDSLHVHGAERRADVHIAGADRAERLPRAMALRLRRSAVEDGLEPLA